MLFAHSLNVLAEGFDLEVVFLVIGLLSSSPSC